VELKDGLLPFLPASGGVIALVGAGGKTSALFGLAAELAGGSPSGVLMTTTTHLYDPRLERGRVFDQLVLHPALAEAEGPWATPAPGPGRRVVLAAWEEPAVGKLRGIHPGRVAELKRAWTFVLVEADGSKRRPVKAPAGHEPVVPDSADLVLGLIGLACLGRSMDEATVHRPELFGPLTGCAPGAPIGLEHLAALCRSPLGLFKAAPPGARRVLLLNQADLCGLDPAALLEGLRAGGPVPADLVLVGSLRGVQPQ